MEMLERAVTVDVDQARRSAEAVALAEIGRQADALLGAPPRPGTPEWDAEAASGAAADRQRAWELLVLRIQLALGLDGFEAVVNLRRTGATWALIARAAGSSRQAAHERWGTRVLAVLDRYGDGVPTTVPDDDPAPSRVRG